MSILVVSYARELPKTSLVEKIPCGRKGDIASLRSQYARNTVAIRSQKKGSPIGKPFHIFMSLHKTSPAYLQASIMVMGVYSLFH
jgi:hypothetical protein